MGGRLIVTLGLIYLGFSALGIAAAVNIVRKAGYSGWWVLAGFVPLANVVMVFAFAFADWPVLQDARRAQRPAEPKGHPSFGPAQTFKPAPTFNPGQTPQPAYGYPAAQPQGYAYQVPSTPPPTFDPAAGHAPSEQPRPYGT
jgi:hypothetical protein